MNDFLTSSSVCECVVKASCVDNEDIDSGQCCEQEFVLAWISICIAYCDELT